MAGNIFGGGFFGKPIPLSGHAGQPAQQGALPVMNARPQGQLGVVPPAPVASVVPHQPTAMGPQGPVPMGAKKDCPVCRG